MRHTTKHMIDHFCGNDCFAVLYSSGGVTHTVKVERHDGRKEWHSFKGQHAARQFINEKILMLITSTVYEYAEQRLAFWEQRLKTAENMPVARQAGAFPTNAARQRELDACRGAVQALKEVLQANYV